MTETPESNVFGSLKSISKGAALSTGGRLVQSAVGFAIVFLLTRNLGASVYGVFAYATTVISALMLFTLLGSDKSVLKFVPQYAESSAIRDTMVGLAVVTSTLASVLIGGGLYLFAPKITALTIEDPLLTDVLRIFSAILVFKTLLKILASLFRSDEAIELYILVHKFAVPISRLLAVGLALLLGYSLVGVVSLLLVAVVSTFALGLVLFVNASDIRPSFGEAVSQGGNYFNFSLPIAFQQIGWVLYKRVDILMVGYFLSSLEVGIYNVAMALTALLALPLGAFNELFPPIASRHYSNGEMDELNDVFTVVTRWSFTVSLLPTIAMIVFSSEILQLFGEGFVAGTAVLMLFSVGQFMNAAVGPCGFMLMMTDHQYLSLSNRWIFGILNAVANYLFITNFGFIGAAVATASVLVLLNVTRVFEVLYTERFFPYSIGFWKPILAGALSGVAMVVSSSFVSGFSAIVVGSTCGALTYLVVLLIVGINDVDKELFNEIY